MILSADGPLTVYSVPDAVAENLEEYCNTFCNEWLQKDPNAEKYRHGNCVCYTERDFIEYLNTWIFPNHKSVLIENLGWVDLDAKLPAPYTDCPKFNF